MRPGCERQPCDTDHGQRGPAERMHILATAYSDKAKGGTGTNEPMIWVIPFGKGRVFEGIGEFTIHKEFVSAKVAGQPPRHALNGRFCRLVQNQIGQAQMPADRTEIND